MNRFPWTATETPFQEEVKALAESVYKHAALNNKFYDLWRSRELAPSQIKLFAVNYFTRIHSAVQRLSLSLASIDDWFSRVQIIKNLYDELGHGKADRIHVLVLKEWLDALLLRRCGVNLEQALEEIAPLPETEKFVEGSIALCRNGSVSAAGALLAQEWHAYTQIANLYEGFRNYTRYFKYEEFHDLSEYFYIHIGLAEKQHKLQTIVVASRACQSADDLALLRKSYNTFLDLTANYWNSLYKATVKEALKGIATTSVTMMDIPDVDALCDFYQ